MDQHFGEFRYLKNMLVVDSCYQLSFAEKRYDDIGIYFAVDPECSPGNITGEVIYSNNITYHPPTQLLATSGFNQCISNFARELSTQLIPHMKRFPQHAWQWGKTGNNVSKVY
jgi:hypothetical protein